MKINAYGNYDTYGNFVGGDNESVASSLYITNMLPKVYSKSIPDKQTSETYVKKQSYESSELQVKNQSEKPLLKDFNEQWAHYCKTYKKLPSIIPAKRRIIVIGDIHGDWDTLLDFLVRASVINKNQPDVWIGGDTHIVQVGDQIDSRSRFDNNYPDEHNDIKILNYLTKLHNEAEKQQGAVYSLLGNHELMNVVGDFRYVSDMGLRGFDTDTKNSDIEIGRNERKRQFAPGNELSKFLACTRQVAIIIGNNLFVHGGIVPAISEKYNITDINRLMTLYLWNILHDKKDLEDYTNIFNNPETSPLWTRAFGNIGYRYIKQNNYSMDAHNAECNKLLEPLLKMYNVGKIFVGHTVISPSVQILCNGRVGFVDTGASKAFNNSKYTGNRTVVPGAQLLEILNDKYNII